MSKYIYNHIPDPVDERDHKFSIVHAPAVLPSHFDLRPLHNVPAILDQQNLGSCAPNEISEAMKYCLKEEGTNVFQPARLYIYYFARLLDGSSVEEDTGITIRSGLKSIQQYGVCGETYLPYDISKFRDKPSSECLAIGKYHKNIQYLRVSQDLASIKHCIYSKSPVIIGISVYESLEAEETLKTGVIPLPDVSNEQLLGGHCVSLYSYDDSARVFGMMNSWGTSVGQSGWFTIPYDYILNPQLCSDLWCIKYFK